MKQFEFVQKSMSAYDAFALVKDDPDTEFQFAVAAADDPHHEIEFHLNDPIPGDPTSPVIAEATLSPSGMYVEFRFVDTPVYMTIPAMSSVALGWLRPVNPLPLGLQALNLARVDRGLPPLASWVDNEPPANS